MREKLHTIGIALIKLMVQQKKTMKVEKGLIGERKEIRESGRGQERIAGSGYDQNTLYTCVKIL